MQSNPAFERDLKMNASGLRMTFCPQCKAELRRRLVDGIERLACPSSGCDYVFWENPTPVVAGLVQHGEHFILARNAQWPSDMFSLITGFLEKGESPEHAISRETMEELGIEVDGLRFIGHYSLPQLNQLIIAFAVRAHGEIRPSEENAEVLLLTTTELEGFAFGALELSAQIVGDALAWSNLVQER
jgi:NAD+ diphosphatase